VTADFDLDTLIRPERVHRRLYTDPQIFDAEMQNVFGGTWVYLLHESQLPHAGDFIQVRVGRRPVIVARDDDGAIHALLNRCMHRGTTVEAAASGCAKRFTCPYHGWTYSVDGRLVGVPYQSNYVGLDRSELGLGRFTVADHRGFVFGTLAPSPEPLSDWLGAAGTFLDEHVDRHPGGRLTVLPSPLTLEYRGNWKLAWDNAADGLHATYAHHSYNELGRSTDTATVLERDPASTPMLGKVLGRGHMVVDQRPGIPNGPWSTMRPLPFVDGLVDDVRERLGDAADAVLDLAAGSMVNLSIFPNVIFVGNQLMVVEPISVDRTHLHLYLVVADDAPDEINLIRLRVDEDFVSFGTPDDLAMFERIQDGLSIPELPWIDTSRGLGASSDLIGADGLPTGPITSEAPQRGYLAEYRRLMEITRGLD
jgi:phenylpropionate dioxygenase-like ring-hydroxylating dioxygenase large terminal subunit